MDIKDFTEHEQKQINAGLTTSVITDKEAAKKILELVPREWIKKIPFLVRAHATTRTVARVAKQYPELYAVAKQEGPLPEKEREELREIFKDYTKNYFLIDKLYRDFYYSYDKIKNSELAPLFDTLKSKIDKFYEIDYLEKLLALWSSKVYQREKLPQQKDFYKNNIVKADVRTVVIISDALRYEVGYEISQKLRKEANVKEIKIEELFDTYKHQ